ncbi:MAG: transglutaminase domain-containing protein [Saprospiraceae bacterium]|nr:transglutaminase domain-containing protein [Saprospiraceae bacterium]
MKPILPFLFLPFGLLGQNFLNVDKHALNTPPGKTRSIETLSEYLCGEQPDDAHKIRAIYAWITLNVAYVDSSDERALWATPEHLARQHPEKVLQNRSAVCQGYANLFCALAAAAGIPCEVITGIVKNADGDIEPIGHAWTAARIRNEWRLFDPTWGVPPAGLSRWKVVDRYFMTPPEEFVLKHLPDDPVWQLLESPLSEKQFREQEDLELLAYLRENAQGEFKFRDTLQQWLSMDTLTRMMDAESRILQFNGSNERVVFGLGQHYWGLFFDLRTTLDSLAHEAILQNTISFDTLWYLEQIEWMDRYHQRARLFFEKLETPERIRQAEKFYSPQEVAVLLDKSEGDVHTALFQSKLAEMPQGVLQAGQIARLHYAMAQAEKAYARAERAMDCRKLPNSCFEIRHNRSLMAIQLAQRQVRLAQELANDQTAASNRTQIQALLANSRRHFLDAIADCESLRRGSIPFTFVEERSITARQGLYTLRTCALRADRTALSPEAESALNAQKLPVQKAETLVRKMERITREVDQLEDSLRNIGRELGEEFARITQFNLQIENFALQFNLASLQFRLAWNLYDNAIKKNTFSSQRKEIRDATLRAQKTLQNAGKALDFMEDSGRLPMSSIQQKQMQINKLSKAIKELLEGL